MAENLKSMETKRGWKTFEKVFGQNDGYESEFSLPRYSSMEGYYTQLETLLNRYETAIGKNVKSIPLREMIHKECQSIRLILAMYFHGDSTEAFDILKELMKMLDEQPLYNNTKSIPSLYRMAKTDGRVDDKLRAFHAPYNLRYRVGTNRYSTAGFPSLYLSESLKLTDEETQFFKNKEKAIAARFELDRDFQKTHMMKILEFGYRPQDFLYGNDEEGTKDTSAEKANADSRTNQLRKLLEDSVVESNTIKDIEKRIDPRNKKRRNKYYSAPSRYMLWYPLIAACSFARPNRDNPFAPEYTMPQLLAQWMRDDNAGSLVGIRYFSCYSKTASELGCNYVFPTSGDVILLKDGVKQYCPELNEAFLMTNTVYLPDYSSNVESIETALNKKRAERLFRLTRDDFEYENKVELPTDLMYIAARSFLGCEKLKNVKNMDNIVRIGGGAFYNCTGLKFSKLPEGLTSIGDYAFCGCTSLMLTELPEGLRSIEDGAFQECTGLKLTKLPEELTSIGNMTFYNCTGVALKKLPERLTSIGGFAFSGCTSLALTELPEGLTSISDGALDGCVSLALAKLPEGLTSIGDFAFSECTGLNLTALPEGIISIGRYAFIRCTGLKLTKLPEGLMSIGKMAFWGCSSITGIELPDSLTEVGLAVFANCENLTNIRYSGTKKQWLKINKDKEWDYGTLQYTFHFGDGTVMTKKELHAFEGRPDLEEEQGDEEIGA